MCTLQKVEGLLAHHRDLRVVGVRASAFDPETLYQKMLVAVTPRAITYSIPVLNELQQRLIPKLPVSADKLRVVSPSKKTGDRFMFGRIGLPREIAGEKITTTARTTTVRVLNGDAKL